MTPLVGEPRGTNHRACIFCTRRDRKITGEHVLGNWLTEFVGPGNYLAQRTAQDPLRRTLAGKPWSTTKVADLKVTDVCAVCNGRLERVIEGPVQPVVKRLIVGEHVELSIESQSALSMWLYKIAILFRYTETNPREASRDELDDLLVRVRPRSGTHIFVGSYGGSYHVRIAANQLGKLRVMQGRDAVQNLLKLNQKGRWEFQEHVTVAAGRFCAQVSLYPPRSNFTYGPSAALMRQIWPALGPVNWPPLFWLDDGGLASLEDITLT